MELNTIFTFIGGLGASEMIFIGVILLVFFGANKIPELMKGLGKGIKEFKDASKDIKENIEKSIDE